MIEGQMCGIDIISNSNLVKQDGFKKVKKTFRERFTWKFWETYKVVPNIIPDLNIYKQGNTITCHPIIVEMIKKQADKDML